MHRLGATIVLPGTDLSGFGGSSTEMELIQALLDNGNPSSQPA